MKLFNLKLNEGEVAHELHSNLGCVEWAKNKGGWAEAYSHTYHTNPLYDQSKHATQHKIYANNLDNKISYSMWSLMPFITGLVTGAALLALFQSSSSAPTKPMQPKF